MNKLITVTACAITLFALFSLPVSVAAQSHSGNTFSIVINPTYPTPYSTFKLYIKSFSFNVSNTVFVVKINGVQTAQGTGSMPVLLKTTGAGTVMNITVYVTNNGRIYKKTLIIHPAGVAVVVEPLTTVPFLYPGMPTISAFGKIRIVAVPEFRNNTGAPILPKKLSYIWRIGNQTLSTSSGVGHSVIILSAPPPYKNTKLTVTVQSQDYSEAASGAVTLTSNNPTVRIYKDDPLMGTLYEHALFGKQTISSTEASFVAQPYGFSISSGLPSLVWYLNGTKAQTGDLVTLRPQGIGKGIATLSISAARKSNYEFASDAISLKFGEAARGSLGIFGL